MIGCFAVVPATQSAGFQAQLTALTANIIDVYGPYDEVQFLKTTNVSPDQIRLCCGPEVPGPYVVIHYEA